MTPHYYFEEIAGLAAFQTFMRGVIENQLKLIDEMLQDFPVLNKINVKRDLAAKHSVTSNCPVATSPIDYYPHHLYVIYEEESTKKDRDSAIYL